MDRCSIPIREVSILWSYIDILLLPSGGYQTDFFSELYFILLCVLVLLVNYLLSSACWSFTFSSSLGCCFSLNYIIYHFFAMNEIKAKITKRNDIVNK